MLADAAHIAESSGVELEIDIECLPLSDALLSERAGEALELAIKSGDDYELLFTVSEANWLRLSQQSPSNIYTKIGRVNKGSGVVIKEYEVKSPLGDLTGMGYKHFE